MELEYYDLFGKLPGNLVLLILRNTDERIVRLFREKNERIKELIPEVKIIEVKMCFQHFVTKDGNLKRNLYSARKTRDALVFHLPKSMVGERCAHYRAIQSSSIWTKEQFEEACGFDLMDVKKVLRFVHRMIQLEAVQTINVFFIHFFTFFAKHAENIFGMLMLCRFDETYKKRKFILFSWVMYNIWEAHVDRNRARKYLQSFHEQLLIPYLRTKNILGEDESLVQGMGRWIGADRLDIIKEYVEYGYRVTFATMKFAILKKKHAIVQYFFNLCNYSFTSDYTTALHYAASCKNPDSETIPLLIKMGISPNVKNILGYGPIDYAIDAEIDTHINQLLSLGASPNRLPEQHMSPLKLCAMKKYHRGLELLLEAGADANYYDQDHLQAIFYAWDERSMDMIIRAGADIHVYNETENCTPMFYFARQQSPLLLYLADNGCDINERNAEDDTPLLTILYKSNIDMNLLQNIMFREDVDLYAKNIHGMCLSKLSKRSPELRALEQRAYNMRTLESIFSRKMDVV